MALKKDHCTRGGASIKTTNTSDHPEKANFLRSSCVERNVSKRGEKG